MPLSKSGTRLFDRGTQVLLKQVNDSTVKTWLDGAAMGQYLTYKYHNHNLPQYTGDTTTIIPATSDREFWHKYFWLIKNALGGQLTTVAGTFTTALNGLRVGPHDAWARDIQYACFKNYREAQDQIVRDMLDMAKAHGCYVTLNLAGGGAEASSAFGVGPIFVPGTEAFNRLVQYEADFINAYGDHDAVAMFDLMNEPNNLTHTVNGNWVSRWWYDKYGENWETAYLNWKNALVTGVKAKLTINPKPLITVGNSWVMIYNPSYQVILDRARAHAENLDVVCEHPYDKVEADANIVRAQSLSNDIGKPWFFEEYGFNGTDAEPWYSYWPWFDQIASQRGLNTATMVLWGMTSTTGRVIPAYPGYPVPQSVMDSIPPVGEEPGPEPEPEPRPVSYALPAMLMIPFFGGLAYIGYRSMKKRPYQARVRARSI
ncbi:MAG: cellulase family glycosylhydrolase [Candidatus Thermoplasmatota archaeon]|nr:cellulase family glycosylhydrolase [Candidatus Thermoplasmatota archaeon]